MGTTSVGSQNMYVSFYVLYIHRCTNYSANYSGIKKPKPDLSISVPPLLKGDVIPFNPEGEFEVRSDSPDSSESDLSETDADYHGAFENLYAVYCSYRQCELIKFSVYTCPAFMRGLCVFRI